MIIMQMLKRLSKFFGSIFQLIILMGFLLMGEQVDSFWLTNFLFQMKRLILLSKIFYQNLSSSLKIRQMFLLGFDLVRILRVCLTRQHTIKLEKTFRLHLFFLSDMHYISFIYANIYFIVNETLRKVQ